MPSRGRTGRGPIPPPLSARERLLFEAGIKLGGLFHQYIGVPVSPRTAPGLARTIAAAVRLQPYVRSVTVAIDPARGGPVGRGRYGYRYLTAEMLTASVTLADGDEEVTAGLAYDPALRYPLMQVAREAASAPEGGPGRRPAQLRRSRGT